MNTAALTIPGTVDPQPDARAIMIAQIESGELTTTLSDQQLSDILVNLNHALTFATAASTNIACGAGPQAEGLAAHLKVMTDMGTGYLRHCVDTIRALRRDQASRKKGAA